MFRSFEKSCPLLEARLPDWNLSLVLWCLFWPPFKPLKLASGKRLTWKMSFLLALVSFKKVNELHGLSFRIRRSRDGDPAPSSFVAKTQNPSVPDPCFDEFTVPSLNDFLVSSRDELLLCPITPSVSDPLPSGGGGGGLA